MAQHVFAVADTFVTAPNGTPTSLHEGDIWRADDPLVLSYPGLFTEDGTKYVKETEPRVITITGSAPRVEQATSAPGERRNVRRPE